LKTLRLSNLHFITIPLAMELVGLLGFYRSPKTVGNIQLSLEKLHKRKNVALHGVRGH
jgi:hypothetical protein